MRKAEQTAEQVQANGNQARKDYMREWRKKNRDKVREYDKRYWERKAAGQCAGKK